MGTKLIQLGDNVLVEVEVAEGQAQPISGGLADKVAATFDQITPVVAAICSHIASSWKDLNKDVALDQAEVTLGLSFEAEGNLYITKSKATANLTVKLVLKPTA
jgi:hypothetical protein